MAEILSQTQTMANTPSLSDAGNDVLAALKRQGGHEVRDSFNEVFKMVLEADRFFSGCWTGSGKQPNPKGRFLGSLGLPAYDADTPEDSPFDLSPRETSLVSNVLDTGLASLEDTLAPYLSKDKTLEKRFTDFLALCSVFIARCSLHNNDAINKMYYNLDRRSHDQTLSPEQRENSRRLHCEFIRVSVKRAVMRYCPALCLMELMRANTAEGCRALELAFRHINKNFWDSEAFCREAVKITGEALEWVNKSILEKWQEHTVTTPGRAK